MVKRHLKQLTAPKSWPVGKKGKTFVTRPMSGAHKLDYGMPLSILFTALLKQAATTAEAKKLLWANDVLIDGVRRKDLKFSVGLFDAISLHSKESKKHYRLLLSEKGKFFTVEIDEKDAVLKPCKILCKRMIPKGALQLNLSGGRTVRIENKAKTGHNYNVGDTVVLKLPKAEIVQHLKLEKGCLVYMTSGAHIGKTGQVDELKADKIVFKSSLKSIKKTYETLKKYAFVIGKEKPIILLSDKGEKEQNKEHNENEKEPKVNEADKD